MSLLVDSGPKKGYIRHVLDECIPTPALPREAQPLKSGLASVVDIHCLGTFSQNQQDKQQTTKD